jgi:hypothetical protein
MQGLLQMMLEETSSLFSHFNNLLSKLPTLFWINTPFAVVALFFQFINSGNASLISLSLQMVVVTLFYYMSHRFLFHGFLLNPHITVHHEKQFPISRCLELSIDFLSETILLGSGFLFLQYLTSFWFVSPSVLMMVLLAPGISHVFIYSILGSDTHKKHHEDPTKNFGPDIVDHIFGTNADSEIEDSVQHVPCLVQACIITHFAKAYFQWKD